MKKGLLILAVFLLSLYGVSAANLQVSILEKDNLIIAETGAKNATFLLLIKNNEDKGDNFQIYSLISASIYPRETFYIEPNSEKELKIIVVPHESTRNHRGLYLFEYQIKGEETGFFTDKLMLEILGAKEIVEIKVNNIQVGDKEATITLTNTIEAKIEGLEILGKSKFFDFVKTINLSEKEQILFNVPLKEEVKKLSAGEHSIELTYKLNDIKSEKEQIINYLEKGEISVTQDNSGIIVRKETTIKKNEGNLASNAKVEIKKDKLSRLFTSFSEKPTTSENKGFFTYYIWEKNLNPGDELRISATTNYTLPFAILIALIFFALLIKFFMKRPLSVEKRVSTIRTKSGEFALKIKIRVKARKNISDIKISDRVPVGFKLYDGFGSKPSETDENTRKISWDIHRLNAGEERIFTYIIYSKMRIFGNFELPIASGSYKENNEIRHTMSNKTTFVSETSQGNH